jgi:DNA-binding transcriptional LysR family regulator
MTLLRVAYDALPVGRWAPLFQVLLLERPEVQLQWQAAEFPRADRSRLDGADVGLFVEPRDEPQLPSVSLGVSRMAVLTAAGHPLARRHELRVADVLEEPFPGGVDLHPEWSAFWTLDADRGGPPPRCESEVSNAAEGLELVAAGRAIATFPEALADGLPHPGIISLPLVDGPAVTTRLVWRAEEPNPALQHLIDIAREMFGNVGGRLPGAERKLD